MSNGNESEGVAAPPARDPLWHAPLFVLAPARSHSSIVTAMLGRHPQLCAFPELLLFRVPRVGDLLRDPPNWRGVPAGARTAGLCRALAQHHDGEQTPETIAAARRWLTQRAQWSPADVLDHLLAAAAPRIGVEKSPETSSRAEFFARLLAAYPRARFLHLGRHPITSAASMHAAWSQRSYWDVTPELFHQFCVGLWRFQHGRIADLVDALPPDRGLSVRSEDLLNDPHATLPGVCRWLGIDAGPEAIEAMCHPEDWEYAGLGPTGAAGGADAAFLRGPALHPVTLPESIEPPADWVLEPWLTVDMLALAARLGYA